jgi:hypothetical protein
LGIEWHFDLHFDELKAEMETKADEAVLAGMSYMHGEVTPLVPVAPDGGNLAGSGDVGLGRIGIGPAEGDHIAHLYYPGPYALYQHEGIYFRRPATYGALLSHTHGESFFLIQPMLTYGETVIEVVRQRMGL